LGGEPGHHRLPDTVVVRLDLLALAPRHAPHEPPRPQQGQRPATVAHALEAAEGIGVPERSTGDGDHPEQPPDVVGQSSDARPEDVVEVYLLRRGGAGPNPLDPLDVTDQLGYEERISPRLPRDVLGLLPGRAVLAPQEGERQLARLDESEW